MSNIADPGANSPTIQAVARAGRRTLGSGQGSGERGACFAVLLLIMLVPLSMVEGVVQERAATRAQVVEEMGAQWGPAQIVSGPALVVPYEVSRVEVADNGQSKTTFETRYAV